MCSSMGSLACLPSTQPWGWLPHRVPGKPSLAPLGIEVVTPGTPMASRIDPDPQICLPSSGRWAQPHVPFPEGWGPRPGAGGHASPLG